MLHSQEAAPALGDAAEPVADTLLLDSIAPVSKALTDPVNYSADDSIRFEVPSRTVFVYGNSNVLYQDIDLKAGVIELDLDKREVSAYGTRSGDTIIGKPRFEQEQEAFDAVEMRYNFDTKRGQVFGIITEQSDGFLHSQVVKMHANEEIHVCGGKYTTCDHEHPHFYVHMTRAKLIPDKQIVTGPAYLVLEDVAMPIAIPFGFFPNKRGRSSGILMPSYVDELDRGFGFRDGGVYLGLSDYYDLTMRGDIYTLGTWRLSGNAQYALRYKFSGNLLVEYAQIVQNEKKLSPTTRIQWNHRQDPKAHPTRNLSSNLNIVTGNHNRQNARIEEDYLQVQIGSSVNYTNRTQNGLINYGLSASHSHNMIDTTMSLTLPAANLSVNNIYPFRRKNTAPKDNPLTKLNIRYSGRFESRTPIMKLRNETTIWDVLDTANRGIIHTVPISTSMRIGKFLNLTPNATYTGRMYFESDSIWYNKEKKMPDKMLGGIDTVTNKEFVWLHDVSAGASLSTKLYGMYNFNTDAVRAMRHVLTPTVGFTYRPGQAGYHKEFKDGNNRTREYSPYKNGIYGVPGKNESGIMNFNLSNSLELKVRNEKDTITGTQKVSLIENLSISSSYNFLADSLHWSDITVNASNTFFKRLSVGYTGNFSPYAMGKDTLGALVKTNTTHYEKTKELLRTNSTSWKFSTSLALGPTKEKNPARASAAKPKYPGYVDLSMPWTCNLSYTYSVPKTFYYNEYSKLVRTDRKPEQSAGINGSLSLTEKWRVTYRTGWDFTRKDFNITTFGIYRDLHCWEMNMSWTPFGQWQRYEFKLNVKASVFQDLKVQKSDVYRNTF
jgi:hypothetical protein